MNARAVGVIAGLRTKEAAACACLENYLHVLDTNAPINRMEGNFGQARLEEKNSENVRKALAVLRQHKMASATGMDPLAATATGAGLGAALGGAVSFGNPGIKTSAAMPPQGYMGMTHQQYMPQYERRKEFTPEEQATIDANRRNVIPKIFKSQADSPAVDMASPAWAGLGGAGIGAAVGAGVMSGTQSPKAMGYGAAAGGVLGAVIGIMKRKAQNASIEENMRRLPAGAVRRDVQADPVYQAEQDRSARLRAAALAGGAVGGASKWASATGMDPLAATATGAGLGAALGGAVSFGNPGMMGRGALAGGSAGYLVSAVDRIVARRQQRQRMEKPAMTKSANISPEWQAKLRGAVHAIRKHPRMATAAAALGGAVIPGAIGYGLGSALGGVSNIGEADPMVAKRRRARFALMGMGLLGGVGALGGASNMQRVIHPPKVFALPEGFRPLGTRPIPV